MADEVDCSANAAERRQTLFELFNEIGIIGQLANTQFHRRMPNGLHVSHFSVINHLARLGDGRTPQQIARAFEVSKATMTNTLMRLGERELIELRPHPTDGRSKLVYLTPQGVEFRDAAVAALHPLLDSLHDALNVTELLEILPTLRNLRSYLDAQRDTR